MTDLQPHNRNGSASTETPWPLPTSPPTQTTNTEAARYQHARVLQQQPAVQSPEPWSPMHLLPLVTTGLFGSGLITAVIMPEVALVLLVTVIMASLIATMIIGVRVHDRHLGRQPEARYYASQHTLSYGRRVVRAQPGAAALDGVEANSPLPLPHLQHTPTANSGGEPLGHPGICRKSCECPGQRGDRK